MKRRHRSELSENARGGAPGKNVRSGGGQHTPLPAETSTRTSVLVAVVCVLLLLAVALVFGQTLGYGFVNYDDAEYVYENPHLAQGLSIQGIGWAFTATDCCNWHPLTWLSYLLDYQLYGLEPWGYHLTNIVLHAASAILLFLVLWRMTGDLWPSAFVAAVFAIHPLRAESVAWVAERKDVLSGLFFMLTLAAYVGYVRRPFSLGRYAAVAALFALGLMAKPMLVTLPLVLLLLDYWPLERMTLRWRLVLEKLPLLALSAASCAVTPLAQSEAVARLEVTPLSLRIANGLVSYAVYVVQLFCPMGLAAFYPYPDAGLPIWQVAGAGLLLAGICVGAIIWRRKYPCVCVGWYWYLGMLVPVIGLVQVGFQSRADRYTYLPQIGLLIALAWAGKRLFESWPRYAWAWGGGSVLIVAVLMGCARQQTSYWRSSEALWNHALDCTSCIFAFTPHNAVARYNLANALADQGRAAEAIGEYEKALEIKADYAEAHNNLGNVLVGQGHAAEGIAHFHAALKIRPDFAKAQNNLGNALVKAGHVDEAIAEHQKALQSKPDFAEEYYNLGNALVSRGRVDEAIVQYKKALEIKPDFTEALYNLGNALMKSRRVDEAIFQYRKVLQIKPDYVGVHNNLGVALAQRGEFDEAKAHFQAALKIKPDDADAIRNLDRLRSR